MLLGRPLALEPSTLGSDSGATPRYPERRGRGPPKGDLQCHTASPRVKQPPPPASPSSLCPGGGRTPPCRLKGHGSGPLLHPCVPSRRWPAPPHRVARPPAAPPLPRRRGHGVLLPYRRLQRWAAARRHAASNGAAAVPCHAAPSGGAWPPTTLRCPGLTQAAGGGGQRQHSMPLDRRGQGVLLRRRHSIRAAGGWTTSGQRERRGPGLLHRRHCSSISSAAQSPHAKPPPQKTPAHAISWVDPTLGARPARCPSPDAAAAELPIFQRFCLRVPRTLHHEAQSRPGNLILGCLHRKHKIARSRKIITAIK